MGKTETSKKMGYENINQFHNNINSIDKTFTNNDKIKAIKY